MFNFIKEHIQLPKMKPGFLRNKGSQNSETRPILSSPPSRSWETTFVPADIGPSGPSRGSIKVPNGYSSGEGETRNGSDAIEIESEGNFTVEEREVWNNKAEFLLSLIGFAVGLTNIWRFPYLAQKNGGGAFIVPYIVMVILEGVPLLYLELAIGQRYRKGGIGCWNEMAPLYSGIGLCSLVASCYVCYYYTTILAWCLFYFVVSFQSPLPWAACPQHIVDNITVVVPECQKSGPTSYFWYRSVLDLAPDIEEAPGFNWRVALSLVAAWLLIYLCVIKGIQSAGKVVYFTATFPFVVLTIFLIRGLTLEGFQYGLKRMVVPEWESLLDASVWLSAATQTLYSYGVGFGSIIALSSYSPVRSNFLRDTILTTTADIVTSVMGCVVVFCVLGFRATYQFRDCVEAQQKLVGNVSGELTPVVGYNSVNNTECDFDYFLKQTASGTGLVFIVFTEAINEMPISPLWSILFFLMLITLGIDTLFATMEGAIVAFDDLGFLSNPKKHVVYGVACFLFMAFSMSFATCTGPYIFELFDTFSVNLPLLVIALSETVCVSYSYGLRRISDDIHMMLGYPPGLYWLLSWRYVMPMCIVIIIVSTIIDVSTKGVFYHSWNPELAEAIYLPWPWWCMLLAGILVLLSIIWIPVVALTTYLSGRGLLKQDKPTNFPLETLKRERGLSSTERPPSSRFQKVILGFED